MYKIIYSEKELKKFFDLILPPLEGDGVYFVSLSARNKYLSEEERIKLNLGRTEMFNRQIIRHHKFEIFLRKIRRFETNLGSYTTKNDSNIPENLITCYININPSSSLKAYKMFSNIMTDYIFELAEVSLKNQDKENILSRINKQDILLMNCYQKSRQKKYYIDIDLDVPKNSLSSIKKVLKLSELTYFLVETKSGFHVLIDLIKSRNKFSSVNNPQTLVVSLKRVIKIDDAEIKINTSEMLPLPGTYQAGFKVKIL